MLSITKLTTVCNIQLYSALPLASEYFPVSCLKFISIFLVPPPYAIEVEVRGSARWLRHCTISWKVAGSIPNDATGIIH